MGLAGVGQLVGHQERSSLPKALVKFLDSHSLGRLEAITWIEPHRERFTAHFERDGKSHEQRVFAYRANNVQPSASLPRRFFSMSRRRTPVAESVTATRKLISVTRLLTKVKMGLRPRRLEDL